MRTIVIIAASAAIAAQTGIVSSLPRMTRKGARPWPTTISVAQAGPSSALICEKSSPHDPHAGTRVR